MKVKADVLNRAGLMVRTVAVIHSHGFSFRLLKSSVLYYCLIVFIQKLHLNLNFIWAATINQKLDDSYFYNLIFFRQKFQTFAKEEATWRCHFWFILFFLGGGGVLQAKRLMKQLWKWSVLIDNDNNSSGNPTLDKVNILLLWKELRWSEVFTDWNPCISWRNAPTLHWKAVKQQRLILASLNKQNFTINMTLQKVIQKFKLSRLINKSELSTDHQFDEPVR